MAKKKAPNRRGKKVSPKRATASSKPKGKIAARVKRREPAWVKDLRKRKEPLSLAIDDMGQIEFWRYSFNDGTHLYNLMVWHPEGDLDFGSDELPRRERYGLEHPSFRRLSYKAKRARVLEELEFHGKYEWLENLPWDDTEQGLDKWLDSDPDYEEFCDPPVSAWDNQYRPGHEIFDALTPEERRLLGIDQGDAGGMASGGCMVTGAECSMEDLNEIIRRKNLPFVVVEDKRRTKPTTSVFGTK